MCTAGTYVFSVVLDMLESVYNGFQDFRHLQMLYSIDTL